MSSELPENWLIDGFVRDDLSQQMEDIQDRQFLRTGVKPCAGQRVELTLKARARGPIPFRLSGQVASVKPEPTSNWRPMSCNCDCGPGKGSMALSEVLGAPNLLGPLPGPGLLCMPTERWATVSSDIRESAGKAVIQQYGAKHGQEVVCEARLNYDYDMRRASEEGPWGDDIPFDARDVWQFTLHVDDSKDNIWVIVPDSFRNLGRSHRPRCWPWTNEQQVPYERAGIDRFEGEGPNGELMVHLCIGPFGCDGEDHPHRFPGGAA